MAAAVYGVIYLVTNLVNHKQYVGLTTRTRPRDRWRGHVSRAKNGALNQPIYHAIRKYGKHAFVFEVIFYCPDKQSLNASEEIFIRLFNTSSPNGYNIRNGGHDGAHSIDSRARMSRSHKGVKMPPERVRHLRQLADQARGKKRDPVVCHKISIANMGHLVSEKTREILRQKATGVRQSQATIQKRVATLSDGRTRPHTVFFGDTNHSARLTTRQVVEIRSRPEASRHLAREFGVSKTTILLIKRGIARPKG